MSIHNTTLMAVVYSEWNEYNYLREFMLIYTDCTFPPDIERTSPRNSRSGSGGATYRIHAESLLAPPFAHRLSRIELVPAIKSCFTHNTLIMI